MVPVSLLHHLDGPSDGTLDGTQVLLDVTGSMVLGVIKVSVVPHQWPCQWPGTSTVTVVQSVAWYSLVSAGSICRRREFSVTAREFSVTAREFSVTAFFEFSTSGEGSGRRFAAMWGYRM
jgi:hypothetical protein